MEQTQQDRGAEPPFLLLSGAAIMYSETLAYVYERRVAVDDIDTASIMLMIARRQ